MSIDASEGPRNRLADFFSGIGRFLRSVRTAVVFAVVGLGATIASLSYCSKPAAPPPGITKGGIAPQTAPKVERRAPGKDLRDRRTTGPAKKGVVKKCYAITGFWGEPVCWKEEKK